MVIRINDKNQNYNNVTKLLVKPYEIMDQKTLQYVLEHGRYPKEFKTLSKKITEGIEKGYIVDAQAKYDSLSLSG